MYFTIFYYQSSEFSDIFVKYHLLTIRIPFITTLYSMMKKIYKWYLSFYIFRVFFKDVFNVSLLINYF